MDRAIKDRLIRPDMGRNDFVSHAKKLKRAARERKLGGVQCALPAQKFGVILADPEWRFEPWSRTTGMDRAADNHYPTSALNVITGPSRPFTPPGAFRNGGGLLSPGRGSDRGVLVPPGTYGQLRSSKGRTEAHLFFDYGGKAPTAPVLPAKLPGSGLPASADRYFTASGTGAGAVTYRALAKPLAHGIGVIVVAVPLSDLESTLRHLLWVELVVSALVLRSDWGPSRGSWSAATCVPSRR